MNTLRIGSSGDEVKNLQEKLLQMGAKIVADGQYGAGTAAAVKEFQTNHQLDPDGIAGPTTLQQLFGEKNLPAQPPRLGDTDMAEAAKMLGIDTAAIQAVRDVETGGRSGFLIDGRPVILFEGHIFWKQLQQRGIDPNAHTIGNEDILYPSWTTIHYKRGAGEYDRLGKAKNINEDAAISSASWGLFQIMGFNHVGCGYSKVIDYVNAMYKGEKEQLMSFVNFLKNNGYVSLLKQQDWAGFAKKYNGAGYAANKYDVKLKEAFDKHHKV